MIRPDSLPGSTDPSAARPANEPALDHPERDSTGSAPGIGVSEALRREPAPASAGDALSGPDPGPSALPAPVRKRELQRNLLLGALSLVVLILGLAAYLGHRDRNALRQELAQRLSSSDEVARQSQLLALGAQRTVREMETSLAALQAQLAESRSQQLALESLYQDLARGRDEAALAEIEQTLTAANQQLVLAGNVKVALIALQSADTRLARIDRAQLVPLRRVLARDIERLQGVPLVDTAGIALRLDRAVAGLDALPTVARRQPFAAEAADPAASQSTTQSTTQSPSQSATQSANPAATQSATPATRPAPESAPAASSAAGWREMVTRAWAEFRAEFRQLANIRRIDQDALPLLAPEQAWFLRENLRLRLLSARIALLARDQNGFRSDVSHARLWIARYFDPRDASVSALAETLRELERAEIRMELPDIGASIEAVRVLRASRDRRQ